MWLEIAFKFVFSLAVIIFCLAVVLSFLLIIKIIFLFNPDFIFLGIHFSPAGL